VNIPRPLLAWFFAALTSGYAGVASAQPAEPDAPEEGDDAADVEEAPPPDDEGAPPAEPPPEEEPPPPPPAPPAPTPEAEETEATRAAGEADVRLRDQLDLHAGPITLRPIVLVQVHATPFAGEDALIANGDIAERGGFRLRRARFGLGGDIDARAAFAVSAELSSDPGGIAQMHDAWVGYTEYEFLSVYAGAQTTPMSRSALTNSGNVALLERPLAVRALAPEQQVGAQIAGRVSDGFFSYALGLFNGFQRNPRFYEGYEQSFAPLGNRFDGLAYGGRVGLEPLGPLDPTIHDLRHSEPRFGVGGGYFFSDGGARNIHIAGGDALLHAYGLHVLGELLWSRAEPETRPTTSTPQLEDVTSFGLIAEAGYVVLRETLGLAIRFEWIDPNSAIEDESDDWLLTAGASFYFVEDILRLQAEFTHREETKGQSLDNDTFALGLQLAL
jgi:hypothetical protein